MNYYREIRNKVGMDFLTHNVTDFECKKGIENNGDKVFLFPKFTLFSFLKLYKKLDIFFKNNHDYDIIHCNMPNASFIYFHFARKYNIKVQIIHSHQDKYSDSIVHSIRNYPLIRIGEKMATNRIACSKKAGKILFKKHKFDIINNAIDTKKYIYNEEIRNKIRKELGIEKKFVIGNVGRLVPQKNQMFLINVFNEIHKKNNNSVLLIIGEGKLEEKLKEQVKKLDLNNEVIFIKNNKIVDEYMQAMDVFVMPSLYEGIGIANIEAQASGLHVITSDVVSNEVQATDKLVEFISLKASIKEWDKAILKWNNNYQREDTSNQIRYSGFDIHLEAEKMLELYKKYMGKNNKESKLQ